MIGDFVAETYYKLVICWIVKPTKKFGLFVHDALSGEPISAERIARAIEAFEDCHEGLRREWSTLTRPADFARVWAPVQITRFGKRVVLQEIGRHCLKTIAEDYLWPERDGRLRQILESFARKRFASVFPEYRTGLIHSCLVRCLANELLARIELKRRRLADLEKRKVTL